MKEFSVQEVKDMITPLTKRHGTYTILINHLNSSRLGWKKLTEKINAAGCKDVVDIINWLEN